MVNSLEIKKNVITEYWLERLSGDLPPMNLPFNSTGIVHDKRESIIKEFSEEITVNLKKIAKSSDMALSLYS